VLCVTEIDVRTDTLKKGRGFSLAALPDSDEHEPAEELTFAQLVAAHAAARCDGSDTRLRKWVDKYGPMRAWDVKAEELHYSAERMLEVGYTPAAVNRDLSALGSAYRWIKTMRKAPKGFRSPTLDVPRFEEPIRRVEISRDQLERLRKVALTYPDRRFGVFVSLLIDTGARKSELLDRYGREFHLERCEVLAPVTKTDKPRVLFFTPSTADLMRRLIPNLAPDRLVFEGRVPGLPISYRKAWATATRDVGLVGLHMHDVRHAVAASLLRAGVTLPVAAQVLGHDPAVLARRYGHLETAALRRAQEAWWRGGATAN
jgi:integrase